MIFLLVMESWSYVSGGKVSVSNETISVSDSFSRSKSALISWDLKSPYSFGNSMLVSDQQALRNQGFGQLGFQELLIGRQLPNNDSVRDASNGELGGGGTVHPILALANAFSGDDESTSKLSCSVVDSTSRDSSLIDLKLGRFADNRGGHDSKFSKGAPMVSSSESSTPSKRARVTGLNSHTAYCQVYGCNKDLSSSKEYHKRHKVCEVHSKTAKVIVNGIEQRFCQQCSRFHLLAEFDDDKRSCRKRLAGHNERRRKPQLGIHSGRSGRLLQSYNGFAGSRFQGTVSATTSFICQDLLPSNILHPDKYGTNIWCKRVKVEDGTAYAPPSAIPIINGNLHSKPPVPSNEFEKLLPSFHENGSNMAIDNIFNDNSTRYPHDFGDPHIGSRPLFQEASLGSEDFSFCNTASTIQGLSGMSDSGCALSLLSSQSGNSSSHLSGIPMARSLVLPANHVHYSIGQVSEKLMGVSSRASANGLPNKLSSTGVNSSEGSQLCPILLSDGIDAPNFDIPNGIYQGTDFLNAKNRSSCEDGPTIDLLQLSSQLQRVEHQRQIMQVKQENDAFCCLRIT